MNDPKPYYEDPFVTIYHGDCHPCPKPVLLLKRLMLKTKAASVLDPFMGSGTTLVAAKELGIRAVGIEQSERYCETAAKRLTQEAFDLGGAA